MNETTAASSIASRRLVRVEEGEVSSDIDAVAVEAPLEIRSGGRSLAVVLRTPGHDLELVRGLLFGEGVLVDPAEAQRVREAEPATLLPHELGHVVEVDLDPALIAARWPGRSLPASSACGACGAAALSGLEDRCPPVRADLSVSAELVSSLPDELRRAQAVFAATGGLHASGLFTAAGELVCAREDVGRHNTVDKLVGWALLAGRVPLSELVLCVSGRLGYEIVHKAIAAGIPIVVAVSAPTSLAVDLAERFRVTTCGFARGDRFNVYSHSNRVDL